jgi:hypothetical protein
MTLMSIKPVNVWIDRDKYNKKYPSYLDNLRNFIFNIKILLSYHLKHYPNTICRIIYNIIEFELDQVVGVLEEDLDLKNNLTIIQKIYSYTYKSSKNNKFRNIEELCHGIINNCEIFI